MPHSEGTDASRVIRLAMTDPSFLVLLASLLAMLANKPGRAQLVWLFAGSVLGPVLTALYLTRESTATATSADRGT